MRRLVLALLLVVVPAWALHPIGTSGLAVGGAPHSRLTPSPDAGGRTVAWLLVDPRHPRTLFIGGLVTYKGYTGCPANTDPCAAWAMRSTDGGATWVDLTGGIQAIDPYATNFSPLYLSADGRHLYMDVFADISPDSSHSDIIYSADAGAHWRSVAAEQHIALANSGGGGYLTPDPLSPRRLSAVQWSPGGEQFGSSSDAGAHWAWRDHPAPFAIDQLGALGSSLLVADQRRFDTVYANVAGPNGTPGATFLRSDDAGRHWTTVRAPTRGLLDGFTIIANRYEGTLLVGRPEDGPADRLTVSPDEGRTWRFVRCPGDLRGACPAFIVDNAFGTGASYAVVRDGIYRFRGTGPAEDRPVIGAHLPVRVGSVVAVGSGGHAGDPVFVATAGRLYRTLDAGRTWAALPVARLPQGFR